MKKLLAVSAVLLLAAGMVFAGGSQETTTESGTEPIKIGAMYALSGTNAAIGTNIMRGVDFAVEMINEQGGVNGRPVEIVRGDTQGDPKVGRSVAERLITQDGVHAILGLTAISTVDNLSTFGFKYFFRMCPMNSLYVENQFMYLEDLAAQTGTPIKRIAIFADNSNIGQELIRCSRIYAEKYGMEIVAEIQYSSGATDLTSEVLALKAANPDAVLCESYINDAILFTKTLAEQGYKPPVVVAKANGFADPSYIPATEGISNGIASVVEWNPDLTKGQDINAKFKEKYGVDMNGHSAESFTAVWILKTAFEQAGTTDGPAVRDALASMDIQGSFPNGPQIILPYDRIKFGDMEVDGVQHTQNNLYASVAIAQIQDGEYKTVWPFEFSATEVQYPAQYE